MLTALEIKNFRCFQALSIAPFERINLIIGKNNTGKTALLEAIFLQLGPNNPQLSIRLNVFRGIDSMDLADPEELWGWLFFAKRIDETIELRGLYEAHQRSSLKIRLTEPEGETFISPGHDAEQLQEPPRSVATTTNLRGLVLEFQDPEGRSGASRMSASASGIKITQAQLGPLAAGIFLPTRVWFPRDNAERFSKLSQVGRDREVLETLKLLEPRLRRLAVLMTSGMPLIYGDIGLDRLVPLPMMGEGLDRLLSIVLAIASAPRGIVLIDEIGQGLHHSVLTKMWQALAHAARQADVQLFATTHSYECLTAAHEAFVASDSYDLRVHRLERVDEDIQVITYDQESLDTSLEANWEVR